MKPGMFLRLSLSFTLAIGAGAARSASSLSGPLDAGLTVREAHLACGESIASLTTAFRRRDSITGQAVFQVLTIQHRGQTFNRLMEYPSHPNGDDPMIINLSCLKNSKTERVAIALDGTNFGDGRCPDCEWRDLYSETGQILVLGPTTFGNLNAKRRGIVKPAGSDFSKSVDVQTLESVFISRALPDDGSEKH